MTGVDRSRLPVPGLPRPFRFPAIVRAPLASGFDLRVVGHDAVPVVSLVALIPGGSAADPIDRAGLAAFAADLLDEGAGARDGAGLADALARLGAELDVEVWPDAAAVTLTALSRHVEPAMALLADLLIRPRFHAADVERVRGIRLDRLQQMRAQAAARADRAFVRRLFDGHPYGHHGIGDAAGIRAATGDDIRAFHAARCTPSAVTLVVGGDIDAERAHRLADAVFGDWRGAPPPPAPDLDQPIPASRPEPVLLVPRPGAPQSELRVGHVGVPRTTPDYHALVLWNAVLGGQFVSRLNLLLRQEKGFTYGVRSGFDFRRDRGPFTVRTSVQASATATAVADIRREVAAMAGERPPTAAELARAKAAVGRAYPLGFETAQQVARGAAQLTLHGLPDDHFARFVPTLDAVDEEAIRGAAARHVRPDALTTVVVGDPEVVVPQFAAAGIAVEFEPEDEP
ncbi:MAG: M16 family metallopeptidase [Vicinamibacterales bacterium]